MDGDHHHLRARHLFFFRGAAGDVTHERVVRCLHQPPMASQDRGPSLSQPKSRQNLTFWTCTEPTRGVRITVTRVLNETYPHPHPALLLTVVVVRKGRDRENSEHKRR